MSELATPRAADPAAVFGEHRPLLFSIAYRMLGSVMDAEDVVQECWVRWSGADAEAVRSPKAFLSTMATRLAINHLQSARARREEYVGPWLPEPLLVTEGGAAEGVERDESVSMAFLLLMERLTPTERAVFVLREAFGYDFAEIARVVGRSEENCRQILRRARQHVTQQRPRFEADPERRRLLVSQFLQAAFGGGMEPLLAVLADDVVVYSDGGGRVSAARNPVRGAEPVARFFSGLWRKAAGLDFAAVPALVNGQPGIRSYLDGRVHSVITADVGPDGRVHGIYIVLNPDKLAHVPVLAE